MPSVFSCEIRVEKVCFEKPLIFRFFWIIIIKSLEYDDIVNTTDGCKMKLISFGVPCYNSAAYMEKCVNSLLKGGEDVEIIIVDDGSTKDNTAEIGARLEAENPGIVRFVHQENGGHGAAVNTGLSLATGRYFKVVDSDDWVDTSALKKVLDTIRSFKKDDCPDTVFVNFVYEHVSDNTQKFVRFNKKMPQNRIFTFDEVKKFDLGQYITMHSLIYRTEFLKNIGLELPTHTFYVDNVFIYYPLPFVKKFYYLNVDFYRYYIGRDDQSVNESVIMSRIDQHYRVAEIIFKAHNLNEVKTRSKRLYGYMVSHVNILMTITSFYLIKLGDEESIKKKDALWNSLKEADYTTYKKCRHSFQGLTASDNKIIMWFCKVAYTVFRKIFKFN